MYVRSYCFAISSRGNMIFSTACNPNSCLHFLIPPLPMGYTGELGFLQCNGELQKSQLITFLPVLRVSSSFCALPRCTVFCVSQNCCLPSHLLWHWFNLVTATFSDCSDSSPSVTLAFSQLFWLLSKLWNLYLLCQRTQSVFSLLPPWDKMCQ